MTGSEDNGSKQHSPRTTSIIQHFERQVRLYTDGVDNDLQVANEKLGQLEATQITSNTKLTGLDTSFAHVDRSLAALLRRFDELHTKAPGGRDDDHKKDEERVEDNDDYVADTEVDDEDTTAHRRL